GSMVGFSSSSTDMATFFRRGSMTLSVRYQPTVTISKDEAEVKNQLFKGLSWISGSMIWAADWVKPCNSGSIPEGIKFALKPPDTPAKAAAIPAKGCRPAE